MNSDRIKNALMAMFEGADPYKCECGVIHYEFPEKGGERKMKCGNCGKIFVVRQDLDA